MPASVHHVDAGWLPRPLPTTCNNGLAARFHPDGTLAHLGRFRAGSCADAWTLERVAGQARGRATLAHGSGGTADWEVYRDGHADRFDAWSDNTRPHAVPFEVWVRGWIAEICGSGG